ncbi:MAG: lysylphosphatidylglycerol synthase domain-containing protein, partial [Bacteroidota bacterium]
VALLFLALIGGSFLRGLDWPHWMPLALAVLALFAFPSLYVLKWWVFPSFRPRFFATSLLSLATQGLQVVSAYFILAALGVSEQFLSYLVLFLVSSVVAILPFTIGGVGARELTFIFSYQYLGIDKNLAVAFSLTFFLINLFVSAFGFLFDMQGRRPNDQSTSSDSKMSITSP